MNIPRQRTLAAMAILFANTFPALNPARLEAQSTAKPSPAAPQPDPLPKDQVPAGTQSATPANGPHPAPPKGLIFTVEVYALAQDDAAQVIEGQDGGEARHQAVLALMKQGKARLETLTCCASQSGDRTVSESSDEERYTTEYERPRIMGGSYFSSAFETRNVGDTLEFEASESPDGKRCEVNMAFQKVRLLGFDQFYGNPRKPPIVAQPRFENAKITAAFDMAMGQPEFLGTMSDQPQFTEAAGKPPEENRLVFGKMDSTDAPAGSEPAASAAAPACVGLELSFYSLDREAARQILSGDLKGEDCYNAVKALAARHEAKLERLTSLRAKAGQRAVVEEVNEMRYATEFALGSSGTNASALVDADAVEPSAFQTRNVGLVVYIEPDIDASGKILDLNLAPDLVTHEGDSPRPGTDAKAEPQPLWETRQITSSLPVVIGRHTLIGSFNHPGEDGVNDRKDTGQVWLGFVRATL